MAVDWLLLHLIAKYSSRTLCILICAWAFLQGGVPERTGALILIVAWYLSFLNATSDGSGPAVTTVIVDVVATVAFSVLAVCSRRPWTFFMAACMVNAIVTHFIARTLDPGLFASITLSSFWGGYALLICLAYGIVDHRNRIRRGN